ncbi:DUF3592 domain-containing protein [Streptomyces sp. NPDC048484]|uniref:DUF3592 domain-containing protein n=1 Tax=Streptomyces sp. NPDC048484 TaxID=3155146 RepID=UPI003432ECBE
MDHKEPHQLSASSNPAREDACTALQMQAGGEATVWFLFVLLLLAGPAIIGVGIHDVVRRRRLRRGGISVEGLVVRHHASRNQGGFHYFAVISFVDAQGSPHEFQANGSGVKGLPVGGRAPVRYLPDAPKTARLDTAWQRFLGIALPFGIGIVFTATGIWGISTGR